MSIGKKILKNKRSIAGVYFVSMIMITVISILIIGFFWIRNEYLRYNNDRIQLSKNYIDSRKIIVREKMADILNYIDYKKQMANDEFKKRIKERVYIADSIMRNIYRQNKGKRNISEIKQMILDALRPIRYDNGTGYHFIVNLKGNEILYPVAPEFEGKNLINFQDEKGNYVIRNEIALIKKKQEGFVTGFWRKPDSGDKMIYPKISYIKLFKPLNWYHGYGNYFDDIEKDLQKEIIKRIKQLKIGGDSQVFLLSEEGKFIFSPNDDYKGKNLEEIQDEEVKKIYRELMNVGNDKKGEFFEFKVREGDSGHIPTLAYVIRYPDWNWILGTEIHLANMENLYRKQAVELKKNIRIYILKIILLFCLITLIIYLIAALISKRAKESFKTFSSFFREAASKSIKIDRNKLHFVEFKNLAIPANEMVESRAKIESELRESRENYRSLQNNVPVGIFRVSSEGKFISVNNYFFKMLGYKNEKELMKVSIITFYDNKDERKHLLRKLRKEKIITDYIIKLRRKDGSVFWASMNLRIVYDEKGNHAYHDGIISDVTERILGDNRIKYLNASLNAIRNVNKLITREMDKKELITKACKTLINNRAYKRAWIILFVKNKKYKMIDAGLDEHYTEMKKALHSGENPECIKKALSQKESVTILNPAENKECRKCPYKHLSEGFGIFMVSLRFEKEIYGVFGVTVPKNLATDEEALSLFEEIANDIAFALHKIDLETEHETARELIAKSLKEKKILLQEIHHRVKNNMQIITSLLRLQSGYVIDTEDRKMFEESTNRVKSMALIHEKLYRSEDFEKIDFGEYVRALTRNLIISYGVSPGKVKLESKIDDVMLNITEAIPLGLIINELFTNSLKYAFPEERIGKITVELKDDNGELVLVVSDDGVGLPPDFDIEKCNSLGMELVVTLTRQIKAKMEFKNDNGTVFIFRFRPKDGK